MDITKITTSQLAAALNPLIRKDYDLWMTVDDDKDYVKAIYQTIEDTDREVDYISGDAGFTTAKEFTEDGNIYYAQNYERYTTTITQGVWALGFALTAHAQIFDKLRNRTKRFPKKLARSIRQTIQILGHLPLNLGYSGSLTYGDSKLLFATDHPNASGLSGTFSNKAASGGAFGYTTLQNAILAMRQYEDDYGMPLNPTPDLVTVPTSALFTDIQISYAPDDPTSTQRAINVIKKGYPGLKILVDPWKTSSVAWELFAKEREALVMYYAQRPDMKNGVNEEKRYAWWNVLFALATGVGDPRIVYGNAGV